MSWVPPETLTLLAGLVSIYVLAQLYWSKTPYGRSSPANTPYLTPWVPFLGSIGYTLDPQTWMDKMHKKMGDVFTTTILGQNVTFVSGHKNVVRWAGASNRELNINQAYEKIAGNLLGPEIFQLGATKTMYDAVSPKRLDKFQDDFFAFTMQSVERKLGDSTTWSEPTDLRPFLSEVTLHLSAWILCGRHLAETHGAELVENFHILENDLSILGMVLNFPTPTIRRRNRAKDRTFAIIQQEFRERVGMIQEGNKIDDDFLSAVMRESLDDETIANCSGGEIMKVINKTIFIIYGLIWAAHSNTASGAVAAFYDLLTNPEHIDIILSQSCFKSEPSPGFVLTEQTHLLRCLTETFRRRATGSLVRFATEPFALSGDTHSPSSTSSFSPSGTLIAPPGFFVVSRSPYSLSPHTYHSPLTFNPHRYDLSVFPHELDAVQSPSVSATAGLFAAWGLGRHACPGRFLAYRMVGNLVLAMFGGWEIELVGGREAAPGWKAPAIGGIDDVKGPVMVRWRRKHVCV